MNVDNAKLRAQVAELEAMLVRQKEEAAQQKRAFEATETRLSDLRRRLQSVTYPADTLPPEILSLIFGFYHGYEAGKPAKPDFSPLPLTRVCSAWRCTALYMSELWQSVEVDLNKPLPPHLPQVLIDWFGRAGTRDLSLTIWGFPDDDDDEDTDEQDDEDGSDGNSEFHFEELSSFFVQYCSRLKTLELKNIYGSNIDTLGDWFLSFPVLEHIELSVHPESYFYEPPMGRIGHTPRLITLVLRNLPIWPVSNTIPWQNLTTLMSFAPTYVGECVSALKQLPVLTSLRVSLHNADGSVILQPFRHTALRELHVDYKWHPPLDMFFSAVTFPALTTLELGQEGSLSTSDISAFLLRSSPPLRKLTFDPRTVESLLQFTDRFNLTDLKLCYPTPEVVRHFFQCFATDASFCAELTNLGFLTRRTLNHPAARDAPVDLFVDLAPTAIKQRRLLLQGDLLRLCSLRIEYAIPDKMAFAFPDDKLAGLRELKDQGMHVQVGNCGWGRSFFD
ncbi:hypothetical protein C8F01DRAFT_662809 [Mycena amicta]|nr:hypothetical protein C8F01DRAFT_662809 [Mycena amicta]